jgi:hypothetical protein
LEERAARNIADQHPLVGLVEVLAKNPRVAPEAEQVVTQVFDGISEGSTGGSTVRDEIQFEGVEIWPDPDRIEENPLVRQPHFAS